mmetsp:Transcript_22379/g.46388  ORF Transcript_22379/g.46388 Transcript_22379/m.46388 type:complete len:249 (+) Transcript_22379:115-861(+)
MNRLLAEVGSDNDDDVATASIFGGSYNDGCYGNAGFVDAGKEGRYVLGLRGGAIDEGADEEGENDSEASAEDLTRMAQSGEGKGVCGAEVGIASLELKEKEVNNAQSGADEVEDKCEGEDDDEDGATVEEDPVQLQSDLLSFCFQRAVLNLPATSLPMPVSTFYANHVLKSRPDGKTLGESPLLFRHLIQKYLDLPISYGMYLQRNTYTLCWCVFCLTAHARYQNDEMEKVWGLSVRTSIARSGGRQG